MKQTVYNRKYQYFRLAFRIKGKPTLRRNAAVAGGQVTFCQMIVKTIADI